jgi:hypothetical protein
VHVRAVREKWEMRGESREEYLIPDETGEV